MSLIAVFVATVVAFILGGVYYAVLGRQLATVSAATAEGASMKPWQVMVELARCAVLATVIACLAAWTDADGWADGLKLGLVLWVGFPLVLWVGAMLHEGTPLKMAAIHGGDWLVKLPVLAVILSTWQ